MNNELFRNIEIDVTSLPRVETISFKSLETRFLKINYIYLSVIFLILFAAELILFYGSYMGMFEAYHVFILVAISFLALLSFLLSYFGFRQKAYGLRERDIVYKSGLIIRNQVAIPFNRIQHCEVQQGALDRAFGIAKLKLYTAGGSSSDLTIPGLALENANKLKNFVLGKITDSDEEE